MRSEGTNPRALGTNPRGPREPTRAERIDADLEAQHRAAQRIAQANEEREEAHRAIPKSPMPEELRAWRRGELPASALIKPEVIDDAWSERADLD